jgi:hypothetical protein
MLGLRTAVDKGRCPRLCDEFDIDLVQKTKPG